jgi:uncharacterized protein YhaN
MAEEKQKAADKGPDSPVLSHLKAREKELTEKLKRIAEHPDSKDHDIPAAKARNEMLLKEVQSEIRRLSK